MFQILYIYIFFFLQKLFHFFILRNTNECMQKALFKQNQFIFPLSGSHTHTHTHTHAVCGGNAVAGLCSGFVGSAIKKKGRREEEMEGKEMDECAGAMEGWMEILTHSLF